MPDGRFPAAIEATAYFVVSEALANVAKHALAGSAAGDDPPAARTASRGGQRRRAGGARPEGGSAAGPGRPGGVGRRRAAGRQPGRAAEPAWRRTSRVRDPGPPAPLRVVIAEDAVLLREGLRRVLTDAGLDVVGTAGDAAHCCTWSRPAPRCRACRHPDAAHPDHRGPAGRARDPPPVAGHGGRRLSQHVETEHLFELLADDPRGVGYVLKERVADIAQFTDAIRRVAAGESVIDPQVVSRLVARPRRDSPLQTLTERELAVLALMAEGRSNHAIAASCTCRPRPWKPTSATCSPSSACRPQRKITAGSLPS